MKNRSTYTTQEQIRAAFWEAHPEITRRTGPRGRTLPQNQQPAGTRMAFCDYVEHLHGSGMIADKLAQRVTL